MFGSTQATNLWVMLGTRLAIASAAVVLLAGCGSSGHSGVVVARNSNCVFLKVPNRANECLPPHMNPEVGAAQIGDCFNFQEDDPARVTSVGRETCHSQATAS